MICRDATDLGAYVLGALEPEEARAFRGHLDTCALCRDEVERLALAADHLPLAAAQIEPPPELRRRIMDVVESEARLLAAAAAGLIVADVLLLALAVYRFQRGRLLLD